MARIRNFFKTPSVWVRKGICNSNFGVATVESVVRLRVNSESRTHGGSLNQQPKSCNPKQKTNSNKFVETANS